MIGIVGYTGFVGSNLLQFYKFDEFYNSKNFINAQNKHFDILFFSGIPAVKWYANKYPEDDYEIIENIKNVLKTITCKKIILISTIDVYDKTDSINVLNEDYMCDFENNHTYGKNRFLFEKFISKQFDDFHIVRLPALFGKGLKKNIIYDLINNNQIENIPLNSSFQWYNLDRLGNDLKIIIENNIKVCNLFTEPINTIKIIELFDKIYNKNYKFNIEYIGNSSTKIIYDIKTKYSSLFNSKIVNYICDKNIVLNEIEKFLKFMKLDKSKLCISNICVNEISQLQFAYLIKLYGISNVQIAPTKLIDWNNLNNLDLSLYTNAGLNVYSFQSITYTLDNLNIFDENTNNKLYTHLTKVIDCAIKNNVINIVFGCPKNRKILDYSKNNNNIFIDFFKKVGDYCENKKIIICIENNSSKYGCNYINKINECANLVRQINKKNIKMMVDLGNAIMENDEWYYLNNYKDILCNIDVAHENMKDYLNIHESNYIFNYVLAHNNYDKMINLEMLIKDNINEVNILNNSINNFINLYSINKL